MRGEMSAAWISGPSLVHVKTGRNHCLSDGDAFRSFHDESAGEEILRCGRLRNATRFELQGEALGRLDATLVVPPLLLSVTQQRIHELPELLVLRREGCVEIAH